MNLEVFEELYASKLSSHDMPTYEVIKSNKRYVKITSYEEAKKFIELVHNMGFNWGHSERHNTYFSAPATYYILYLYDRQIRLTHHPIEGCEIIDFDKRRVRGSLDIYKKEMI